MSYAIGEFYFGINLKSAHELGLSDEVLEDIERLHEAELILGSYNGSGDMPKFLAVTISDIDECSDLGWAEIVGLKDQLKSAAAPESNESKEFQKLLEAILEDPDTTDATKEWFKAQTPQVFLTWASS